LLPLIQEPEGEELFGLLFHESAEGAGLHAQLLPLFHVPDTGDGVCE